MMDKEPEKKAELMILPMEAFYMVLEAAFDTGYEASTIRLSKDRAWALYKASIQPSIKDSPDETKPE